MGSETGVKIDLDAVRLKDRSLTAWEILLSESQERMLVVVAKGREAEVLSIFHKWGLDAVVVGQVTDDALLRVRQHGEVVAEIPAAALADDCPIYERPLRPAAPSRAEKLVSFASDEVAAAKLRDNFLRLLASPTIASKRWVFQQYDHTVRTNTMLGPAAGDAAVLRLKGTGRGLALTVDGNGRYCYLNPRRGAQLAVAEAARNLVCVGAKPWAATNCLNFGNPEKPEVMWQFSEVIDGMAEACRAFGTPVTGGNVSFYNETRGKSIYPTPVIGMLGVLDDVEKSAPAGFRRAGSALVLLGGAEPTRGGLEKTFSSSEYALRIHGLAAGEPPAIDLALEKRVHDCCLELMRRGWVLAAHDVSDGGLLVTVAEGCFGSPSSVGAALTLASSLPLEAVCFGEEPSRIVLEVDPNHLADLLRLAAQYQVAARQLGSTTRGEFRVHFNGQVVLDEDVNILKEAWATSLACQMRGEGAA